MRRLLVFIVIIILFAMLPGTTPIAAAARSRDADLLKLMDTIDAYMRAQKFVPGTTRQGSVYLFDLKTGAELTINPDVVYSGVSVVKIDVLIAFYLKLNQIERGSKPTQRQALLLAKMMLCSDNAAANEIIRFLGDGNVEDGLNEVTGRTRTGTQLTRLFSDDGSPDVMDGPILPLNADADPTNNTTATNTGKLMAYINRCATRKNDYDDSPNLANDCKTIIQLMRANQLNNLIEGGVPEGTLVAHKQGWSQDTHGDAAYISTPGGDYILVIFLHQRKFLMSGGSFPVMAEISRLTYNAFNPTAPLKEVRSQPISKDCTIPPEVIANLLR